MDSGSSPLTRGKLDAEGPPAPRGRLIPAHAGKTGYVPGRAYQLAAHPRSRGENRQLRVRATVILGSSPLTRGKQNAAGRISRDSRLIPAHAGKTPRETPSAMLSPAHPRSRGENPHPLKGPLMLNGSSPLTRGKHVLHEGVQLGERLIPAHAGKTDGRSLLPESGSAHPRSRGENEEELVHGQASFGSSPLTRGKPPKPPTAPLPRRLIPAHAGKTSSSLTVRSSPAAHPRSRGENAALRDDPFRRVGSSPLTRGKQRKKVGTPPDRGLIPAHAGKTFPDRDAATAVSAHPRSRGENRGDQLMLWRAAGSSPLTRGKHLLIRGALPVRGLIPAHAGKTQAR